MGFDLNIRAELAICSDTGKPYCFVETGAQNTLTRIYDLSKLSVPKEHRRFLNQRGSIFHVYTSNVFEYDITNVSVSEFIEKYPSWNTVLAYDHDCNYWTEADHNAFKVALEWLNTDGFAQYRIHWSY